MKIDCRDISAYMKVQLKEKINSLATESNKIPRLGIVKVGNDYASNLYVNNKVKDCKEVGIDVIVKEYSHDISQDDLKDSIRSLVALNSFDAFMVQLPLPKHIDSDVIIKTIPINLDVDNLTGNSKCSCATPTGILMLLKFLGVELDGHNVLIIGRSDIVGKPMAKLMLEENANVTICHSHTTNADLKSYCRNAEIIVSAVGKKNFITEDLISPKKQQLLLDVGINRNEDGKICGDADPSIYNISNLTYTPVPNGLGLMTRIGLLYNTILLTYGVK